LLQSSPLPRTLQNKLKSNSGEHWLSFTELRKPHLAALEKELYSIQPPCCNAAPEAPT